MPGPVANQQSSPFMSRSERQLERERKREAVLRAAVRMFNERGFYASSLEDVASSLGVSKPTVYHYLGNKDQVLFECVTRGLEQLQAAADLARSVPGTGLERLTAFLRRYAEINMDDFGRCVIRTSEEMLTIESANRFRALKRDVDSALRQLVQEAMDDGSVATGDVKIVSFAIAGALNWPARWFAEGGSSTPQKLAAELVEVLTAGLKPREAFE